VRGRGPVLRGLIFRAGCEGPGSRSEAPGTSCEGLGSGCGAGSEGTVLKGPALRGRGASLRDCGAGSEGTELQGRL